MWICFKTKKKISDWKGAFWCLVYNHTYKLSFISGFLCLLLSRVWIDRQKQIESYPQSLFTSVCKVFISDFDTNRFWNCPKVWKFLIGLTVKHPIETPQNGSPFLRKIICITIQYWSLHDYVCGNHLILRECTAWFSFLFNAGTFLLLRLERYLA